MADDTKVGIKVGVDGKDKFVTDMHETAQAMGEVSEAASGLEQSASTADSALNTMADESAGSSSTFQKNLMTAIDVVVTGLAGLAAAALEINARIIAIVNEVAEKGAGIAEGAAKLDMGTQAYQEWDYILEKSSSSMAKASTAIQNLTMASRNASDDQTAAFEKIGLGMETVSRMSPEDLFSAVVSGLQNIEDAGERAATANELFGSSWKSLGTLLSSSTDETEALRQKAHDLGIVMSDEMVQGSVDYQESLEDLQDVAEGIQNVFSAEMLGTVSELRTALVDLLTNVDWAELAKGLGEIVQPASEFVNKLIIPLATYSINAAITSLRDLITIVKELKAVLRGEKTIGEMFQDFQNLANPTTPEAIFADAPEQAQEIEQLATALKDFQGALIDTTGLDFDVDPNVEQMDRFLSQVDEYIQKTAEANGDAGMASENTQAWAQSVRELAAAAATYALENPEAWGNDELRAAFLNDLTSLTAAYQNMQQVLSQTPEISAEDQLAAAEQAASGLDAAAETLATNSETLLQTFPETAGQIVSDFEAGASSMSQAAAAAVSDTNDAMASNMETLKSNAYIWGSDMMSSLAKGILEGAVDYVVPAIESVASDIDSYIGFSEPERGPLSDFHTFAPDMMALFASGIRDNENLLSSAIGQTFDLWPLISAAQSGGRTLNYGGVNVVINATESQSAEDLYEVFSHRLAQDVADREAVFSS